MKNEICKCRLTILHVNHLAQTEHWKRSSSEENAQPLGSSQGCDQGAFDGAGREPPIASKPPSSTLHLSTVFLLALKGSR